MVQVVETVGVATELTSVVLAVVGRELLSVASLVDNNEDELDETV